VATYNVQSMSIKVETPAATRYDGSRPGVQLQSTSLYDNFRKPGYYVIMTSLMTS